MYHSYHLNLYHPKMLKNAKLSIETETWCIEVYRKYLQHPYIALLVHHISLTFIFYWWINTCNTQYTFGELQFIETNN